ncbi:hypothetical protein AR457_34075 [Streptomyces agglomeratus]|uniref:Rv1733c family protein n=1 Tax=Streptomyces agglomeratus TaxID=285458 RepID=UPI00085286CE|nr:hypothetical protein [Streptomyces agglomeratus]OEJ37060.1 hypothetical protein BGK70_01575 [Streptomyces agglomeratus]OEJ48413.1 hypothetical protein AR457_34075 [Streptomyces agglomeratus]OEJ49459.1 hypothetical protein BGK72_00080 [Streptomyces agglomeratus]
MTDEIPQAEPRPALRPARLWRWRRSPLRRPTDLVQAWIGLALTLALLAATPLAMVLVGTTVHRSLQQTADEQAQSRHRTTAVLLHDAPRHPEPGSQEEQHSRYPVKVRFTGPAGHPQTATTEVRPGLPAQSTVQVWTTDTGRITDPPWTAEQIRSRTFGSAGAAGTGVLIAGALTYAAAARALDRRRLADWDKAWAQTAPRWTPPT